MPWIVVALALYVAMVAITLRINVPLNDGIKAAGPPDDIADLAEVRAAFNEAKWARWNLVRVTATMIAFGCLTWALVLLGRATTAAGS